MSGAPSFSFTGLALVSPLRTLPGPGVLSSGLLHPKRTFDSVCRCLSHLEHTASYRPSQGCPCSPGEELPWPLETLTVRGHQSLLCFLQEVLQCMSHTGAYDSSAVSFVGDMSNVDKVHYFLHMAVQLTHSLKRFLFPHPIAAASLDSVGRGPFLGSLFCSIAL